MSDSIIDETPILTTKDWSLHHAQNTDHGPLSVFIGPEGQKDARINTLASNLKQFRHPGILRFLGWCPGSGGHLLTEKASPLTVVRSLQTQHALCLGLQDVAQALLFLHEKGGVLHNNICQNAVFVTPAGRWKLAGLEFTTRLDLVPHIHNQSVHHQSEKSRDVLALGILITELLKESLDAAAVQFREFARDQMLLPDSSRRPDLLTVLNQPYFKQDFVSVFGFLRDITLKTEEQKEEFFSSLGEQLQEVPETVIGLQYVPLLLSRYVMVDKTARSHFLPRILVPKSANRSSLLSEKCFQDFVVPQMRTMFAVCDTGIRMVLLEHFSQYCSAIDLDTLEDDILPALLLGLKDTNPVLVAATLRALADLVPLLGPAKVIGNNRSKVFSDGSPARGRLAPQQAYKPDGELAIVRDYAKMRQISAGERVPPLGAEHENIEMVVESDAEAWDSWDTQEEEDTTKLTEDCDQSSFREIGGDGTAGGDSPQPLQRDAAEMSSLLREQSLEKPNTHRQPLPDLDILALDVKLSSSGRQRRTRDNEMDFFADMAPVIPRAKTGLEQFQSELENAKKIAEAKFAPACDMEESGWDDDEWKD